MSSLFKIFNKYPNLLTAFSQKEDGSMNVYQVEAGNQEIKQNRERFFQSLGIKWQQAVHPKLVLSNRVKIIGKEDQGKIINGFDGFITAEKNVFLTITGADCPPIYLYDPQTEVIGLIHCGQHGLAQNILDNAIKTIEQNFSCQPENILAGIGPGISQPHYDVTSEIAKDFEQLKPSVLLRQGSKIYLDLKKAAQIQLQNLGLKPENIEVNPDCTYGLPNKYFSYRRDRPKVLQVMMAVFGQR